jgi:ribonuclease J
MNSYMYGYRGRWLMVDLGVRFADVSLPLGVDVKMPDLKFIEERKDQLEALFLTHAHEDHIGV